MTHFEFISVAVSIVLSFGVVRLLDAVHYVLQRNRLHVNVFLWIIVKLMNHVLFWWALWSYRDFVNWNVLVFIWILLFPGLLYVQVTALVTTTPQAVDDWQRHFESVRRWFLSVNLLLIFHTAVTAWLVLSGASLQAVLVAQALLVVVNTLGIAIANPRVQRAVVLIALATQIFGFGSVFFAFPDATVG